MILTSVLRGRCHEHSMFMVTMVTLCLLLLARGLGLGPQSKLCAPCSHRPLCVGESAHVACGGFSPSFVGTQTDWLRTCPLAAGQLRGH